MLGPSRRWSSPNEARRDWTRRRRRRTLCLGSSSSSVPFAIVARISVARWKPAPRDLLTRRVSSSTPTSSLHDDLYLGRPPRACLRGDATMVGICIGYPFATSWRVPQEWQPGLLMLVMLPLLDIVPAARLRLEGTAGGAGARRADGSRRPAGRVLAGSASSARGPVYEHPVLARRRHGLHVPAVHVCRSTRSFRRWTCASRGGTDRRRPGTPSRIVTVPSRRPASVAGACSSHPVVGEYVIPELLGGTETQSVGRTSGTSLRQQRLADGEQPWR